MYINISCLFLIYVYIYLFQRHFLNISLALDSYLPKDFIDIVEWTLQLAQPVGTRFISSISPPLLARMYLSVSLMDAKGTGLIFREFWLSHRSNPDSLIGELVLPEVPSWPTTQTALITWIGMMSSMQLGTRKKHVEIMSVAEVPAVGLYTHRYFFKKGVLVHVYM